VDVLTGTTVVHLREDGSALLSGPSCGLLAVRAKAGILASGCRERPIGALSVSGTRPSGIFSAGMAQKMINLGGYDIGNQFVILGSGDVGMIMARQLTQMGKNVLAVIEKEAVCGGLARNKIQCLDAYRIPLKTRCTVSRIHGIGRISGVTVRDLENGREHFLACDTLITSVGLIPERELSEEASNGGALPEWLFLCGNACYVHDLVDDVTVEAFQTGRQAAAFAQSGFARFARGEEVENLKKYGGSGSFCIACPKACPLTKTKDGYSGALCGRKDPIPSGSEPQGFSRDIAT
jgi:NADPH-dependent 2,4-dienoyl-CoA reductase/sulfur reductase-like enzyme